MEEAMGSCRWFLLWALCSLSFVVSTDSGMGTDGCKCPPVKCPQNMEEAELAKGVVVAQAQLASLRRQLARAEERYRINEKQSFAAFHDTSRDFRSCADTVTAKVTEIRLLRSRIEMLEAKDPRFTCDRPTPFILLFVIILVFVALAVISVWAVPKINNVVRAHVRSELSERRAVLRDYEISEHTTKYKELESLYNEGIQINERLKQEKRSSLQEVHLLRDRVERLETQNRKLKNERAKEESKHMGGRSGKSDMSSPPNGQPDRRKTDPHRRRSGLESGSGQLTVDLSKEKERLSPVPHPAPRQRSPSTIKTQGLQGKPVKEYYEKKQQEVLAAAGVGPYPAGSGVGGAAE